MKKLIDIAKLVSGRLVGSAELLVIGVNNVKDVCENEITFAINEKNFKEALNSLAVAVIVNSEVADNISSASKPYIVVDNPRLAFIKLVSLFQEELPIERKVSKKAFIGKDVVLGENIAIMANAYIADGVVIGSNTIIYPGVYIGFKARIGQNCLLYANACIRENCLLGNNVIVNCGTVIGSDGFGFVKDGKEHKKIPHVGNVIVGDQVEIGANVTIDRASTGSTIISRGTKIDNLVHIAHSVEIGENCLLVAQTGISGSVKIGKNVTFAGQCGSAGHLVIGDDCIFAARAAAAGNIPAKSFMAGFPARPHKEWLKMKGAAYKVPNLIKKVQMLEKAVQKLIELQSK